MNEEELDDFIDELFAGQIDEAEALAQLDDLGCTRQGAEGHLDRWKGTRA